jgi:hypothetical protein
VLAPSGQILFADNLPNAFTAEDLCVVCDIALDLIGASYAL